METTMKEKIRKLAMAEAADMDENEIFSSPEFQDCLQKQADVIASEAGIPQVRVYTQRRGKNGPVAYTTGKATVINTDNRIANAFTSSYNKFMAFLALLFHELAHCVFLDFNQEQAAIKAIGRGEFYGKPPKTTTPEEAERLDRMVKSMRQYPGFYTNLFHGISNALCDRHDEDCMCRKYGGTVKQAIMKARRILFNGQLSVEEMQKRYEDGKLDAISIALNMILCYSRFGSVLYETEEVFDNFPIANAVKGLRGTIAEAVKCDSIKSRYECINKIVFYLYDCIEDEIKAEQKEKAKQKKCSMGAPGNSNGSKGEGASTSSAPCTSSGEGGPKQSSSANTSSSSGSPSASADASSGSGGNESSAEAGGSSATGGGSAAGGNTSECSGESSDNGLGEDAGNGSSESSATNAGNSTDGEAEGAEGSSGKTESTEGANGEAEGADGADGETEGAEDADGEDADADGEAEGADGTEGKAEGANGTDGETEGADGEAGGKGENGEDESEPLTEEEIDHIMSEIENALNSIAQNLGAAPMPEGVSSSDVAKEASRAQNQRSKGEKKSKNDSSETESSEGADGEETSEASEGKTPGKGLSEEAVNTLLNGIKSALATSRAEDSLESELDRETQKTIMDAIDADGKIPDFSRKTCRMNDVYVYRETYYDEGDIANTNRLMRELSPTSRKMQQKLKEALRDASTESTDHHKRMGKICEAKYSYRPDNRFFAKKNLPLDIPSLAISVLVDNSGSMGCGQPISKINAAKIASLLLYDFCKGLGIPFSMQGFDSTYEYTNFTVYVDFENVTDKDKYRLMQMRSGAGNRDGDAIALSRAMLDKRTEDIKILFLITDGLPSAYHGRGTGIDDCRARVLEARKKGVEVIACCIESAEWNNIHDIYNGYCGCLNFGDLKTLPQNLLKVLRNRIMSQIS